MRNPCPNRDQVWLPFRRLGHNSQIKIELRAFSYCVPQRETKQTNESNDSFLQETQGLKEKTRSGIKTADTFGCVFFFYYY